MVGEREAAGTIESEEHDGVVVLRLLDEHDISTAAALRASVGEAARAGHGVVVSMSQTRFIDSSITHVLYEADVNAQETHRRLVLHVATRSIVRRVLELSGLIGDLPCTASIDAAITLARARDDESSVGPS